LELKLEDDGEHVVEYLKKFYPNVEIEMRSYDDTSQEDKSLEDYEKSFKLVILMY
jgi:hypothetical protein